MKSIITLATGFVTIMSLIIANAPGSHGMVTVVEFWTKLLQSIF